MVLLFGHFELQEAVMWRREHAIVVAGHAVAGGTVVERWPSPFANSHGLGPAVRVHERPRLARVAKVRRRRHGRWRRRHRTLLEVGVVRSS